jgi:hypothetical protein
MYNFRTATQEDRMAERERQRHLLANIPRTPTATYLSCRASGLYDTQLRIEDALIAMKAVPTMPVHDYGCKAAVRHLTNAIPLIPAEIGNLLLAAKYDIDSVAEAADADEYLPGVSTALQRAAKTLHKQKEEAAKKAQEDFAKLQQRRRLQANAVALQQTQAATAVQPASAPASAAATVAAAATGGASAAFPHPVNAFHHSRYPCDACGKHGHWKSEGKCKPEDLTAFATTLAAAASSAAASLLALPAPPGTPGRIS